MWRGLSGGAKAIVVVGALAVAGGLAALAATLLPAVFDPSSWSGDDEDPVPLAALGGVLFAGMAIVLVVVVGLLTYLTMRREIGSTPQPRSPSATHLPASGLPIAVLCAVTAVVWFCWLGWDGHKDVDAFGNETGPWATWQVIGFVVSLAVVCAVAARRLPVMAVMTVMSLTVSVAFSLLFVFVFIPDRPYDAFNGLWVVAAGLIFIGALAGTALVAGMVHAVMFGSRADLTQ